ncbi:hypothetical protein NVP1101O_160 [Vibrio phage 1.101.O._10N.261.45.C6]|nr:hypothetical protein NVP1101O_160 [Vibrio phage 1.101.O._10N.261.45.C6]
MAIQELNTWAKNLVVDGVTEIAQRRDLSEEEFNDGWLRNSTASSQQINQVLYLQTSYAKTNPYTPEPFLASKSTPSICLDWVEGGNIPEVDAPELFAFYGGTFPAPPFTLNAGWKFIVRKV